MAAQVEVWTTDIAGELVTDTERALQASLDRREGMVLRSYATPEEHERGNQRLVYGYPHLSPDSVYVACIGINWMPGAWERVVNMCMHTQQAGHNVWLEEFPDALTLPAFETLGSMRDRGAQTAIDAGHEWLCFVENDALPEPDLLLKLMAWKMPVVGPRIVGPDEKPVGGPRYPKGNGLQPMRWLALSFILFRTKVFNCWSGDLPFTGLKEEINLFQRLAHFGHTTYQDTDTDLRLGRGPSSSAIAHVSSNADYQKFLDEVDRRRRAPPDRKPIDPKTPTRCGIYAPFMKGGDGED